MSQKKAMSEKEMQQITLNTAEQLKKQPKEKVKLYLSPDVRQKIESMKAAGKKVNWPFTTVQINGYTYQIQYGVEVEVPKSVATILRRANLI